MCGIVGFISKNHSSREQIIEDMKSSIAHRGPDGNGTLHIDDVSFGHVRLAIIDLENGKQPMQSHDGRYSLIFNGEIYNFIELRQLLSSKKYKFKTYSDSEVLLYMYAEYGEGMLEHLNGMFSFVIYDSSEKKIFAARDHFGIKPFYYYYDGELFAFASEIKALLKHPKIKAIPDEHSIFEYLTFQMTLKKHTLFKNINKLKPACCLSLSHDGELKTREYWQLNYSIDESKTQEQFADELLLMLQNSLSLQVRSDVPVGAYLSGGIDSSTVAILASMNYMGQLKTFTGGFREGELYDETKYANIVSKSINSDHYEVFPTWTDFRDSFEKLVYHMDEPAAGPGIFPQYMVSQLAAKEVKVVLGGQGGDEVFGGYTRYGVAYLEQCLKGAIFETQEEGKHVVTLQSIIPNMPSLRNYLPLIKSQFSDGLFDEMDKRYYRIIDRSPNLELLYDKEFLSNRNEDSLFEKFSQIFNKPDTKSLFNKMTFYDIKTQLPALLQVEDRVSMAVSLESRVPLLDRRIVELSAKIPPTMKFAGGKTKFMFINSVKNVLPKEILERKDKMGFPVPINEWIDGPLKEYVHDIFNTQEARNRGIYNTAAIQSFAKGSGKFSREIWGAMNLELWFRRFID